MGNKNLNLGQDALRDFLTAAMEQWGAKYELQFSDYKEGQWTVPSLLTEDRINRIVTDFSVKNIRLQFPM